MEPIYLKPIDQLGEIGPIGDAPFVRALIAPSDDTAEADWHKEEAVLDTSCSVTQIPRELLKQLKCSPLGKAVETTFVITKDRKKLRKEVVRVTYRVFIRIGKKTIPLNSVIYSFDGRFKIGRDILGNSTISINWKANGGELIFAE